MNEDASVPTLVEGASPLARYLLATYVLLIVYASLNPFSGWRDPGASPLEFLGAPMPRYVSAFDVFANIFGYLPLGLLGALALRPRFVGVAAFFLVTLLTTSLSCGMETLQVFLPSRVPSNIDLAANALGGMLGAASAHLFSGYLSGEQGLRNLRHRFFQDGARVDMGLVLLALWLMSLLYPGTALFGNGDLRAIFSTPNGVLHPPQTFIRFETMVVTTNTTAIGLLLALLVERGQPVRRIFLALLAAALAARTFCYGRLFNPQSLFDWLTPGAAIGLLAGSVIVCVAVAFPRAVKVALCGFALMLATAVVNYAPENPYFLAALATWNQGHFLNFNGFTRLLSAIWPFFALVYVLSIASGRGRRLSSPQSN